MTLPNINKLVAKVTNACKKIIILKIYSLCLGIFTTIMSHTRNTIQDLKQQPTN